MEEIDLVVSQHWRLFGGIGNILCSWLKRLLSDRCLLKTQLSSELQINRKKTKETSPRSKATSSAPSPKCYGAGTRTAECWEAADAGVRISGSGQMAIPSF